eukprot:5027089-Amphidinium_carterae.1
MLCDSQLPALTTLCARALHGMQALGFVGLQPTSDSEEVHAQSDFAFDVGCRQQVIVFVAHETVFPMSESPEEMATMLQFVRHSLLKNLPCGNLDEATVSEHTPLNLPTFAGRDEDLALGGGRDTDDEADHLGTTAEWSPSEAERKALQLARNNLGHPVNADFARLLRRGGARPEVVRWTVKHFACQLANIINSRVPSCQHRQCVLGYMPQLPSDLMRNSEDPALVTEGPLKAVRRSEHIRAVALQAWAKTASRQRLMT